MNLVKGVFEACETCASPGSPVQQRKMSLLHVNKALDEEVQCDISDISILDEKFEVLNVANTGTGNGERVMVPTRNAKVMMQL